MKNSNKTLHYVVADRETNNIQMEWCDTLEEAIAKVHEYEAVDKADGNYEPNCYEILITKRKFKFRNLTDDDIIERIRP